MKTATVSLDGEERLLCFSTGVMEDVYSEYGGLQEFFDAMSGKNDNPIRAIIWALDKMMDAGARYARRKGIPAAAPLTADELREYLSEIQDKVVEEKKRIIWKGRAKNG